MKTYVMQTLAIFCLSVALFVSPMNAQVGIGTTAPDPSSALDINVANKGLLIPRVALTSTVDLLTIPSPATSLLVFNTATDGLGATSVAPGFYYFDGVQWNAFDETNNVLDLSWSTTGNTGTNATTNYLGTTDNEDLSIATNAISRLRIDNDSFQIKAMGNGSQSQPFYSWNADTNTGIWRKGSDQLAIGAGNLEFITLIEDSTDELVINENSSNNLDVRVEGATEDHLIFVDGSSDNIGIGKSNPSSRLDVFSDSGFAINTSGRIKGIFSRSQTANIGSSGGSFILDTDGNTSNGHLAEGVMAGVLVDGSIVGAYGRVYRPDNNWGMYTVNNSVALQYFTFSDGRLKRDVQPEITALDKVMELNPVSYYWDNAKYNTFGTENRKQHGFIAQELENIFPELVNKASVTLPADQNETTKFDAVNYDGLIPVLTKAIQEQQKLIELLSTRIETLERGRP